MQTDFTEAISATASTDNTGVAVIAGVTLIVLGYMFFKSQSETTQIIADDLNIILKSAILCVSTVAGFWRPAIPGGSDFVVVISLLVTFGALRFIVVKIQRQVVDA